MLIFISIEVTDLNFVYTAKFHAYSNSQSFVSDINATHDENWDEVKICSFHKSNSICHTHR